MSAAMPVLLALSDNQQAWQFTLIAGVVVLLAVILLLELLRRTVLKLGDDLWETWVSGKAVVKNTATTFQLKNAHSSADELVEELRFHG